MTSVAAHYDRLLALGNDPADDPPALRAYMDGWDGPGFIRRMGLGPDKRVLEIGVGTGRLALRTAPLCGAFYGVDVAEKTLERARVHLAHVPQAQLIRGDFLTAALPGDLDVIYSSLTFLHIREKGAAIRRAAALLKKGGLFLLSMDKSRETVLDAGAWQIAVYPDDPDEIAALMGEAGLTLTEQYQTEKAHILLAVK